MHGRSTQGKEKGPVLVEIVTVMPVTLSNCPSCSLVFRESGVEKEVNKEILAEYPAEMRESLGRLSDVIRQLVTVYGEQVDISFFNAHSLAGIYKSFVHHTRTYPAFIIQKRAVYAGLEFPEIQRIIDSYLAGDEPPER